MGVTICTALVPFTSCPVSSLFVSNPADSPYTQTNGERVVGSLKAMALARSAAAGFNRAQWQAQLGPLLRLWDTLMAQVKGW